MWKNKGVSIRNCEIENPVFNPGQVENEQETMEEKRKLEPRSSYVLLSLIFLGIFFLLGRTFYLQMVKGEYYKDVANENRIRADIIKAPRGLIKDAKGKILARNVPSFDAVFVPFELEKESGKRNQMIEEIARLLDMNNDSVKTLIEGADGQSKKYYLLKSNIDHEKAVGLIGEFRKFSGLYLDNTAKREYPEGESFSSILGYDGKITREELQSNPDYLMTDYIGKNGVEYSYEKWLHGKHGQRRIEVDSNGEIKEDLGVISPQPGSELHLYIDSDLQKKSFEILKKILEENEEATGATLVAINPQNGGVLALVNLPTYDNNLFVGGISSADYEKLTQDQNNPLLNRAIAGEYPPGSIFKPIVAAAALEEGNITAGTTLNCSGIINIGQWKFPDWKSHGVTDVKKAIAESCDVFFYALGGGWGNIKGLGMDKMKKYAEKFGLGDITGIDLPWESSGNIPDEMWKFKKFNEVWYIGDNYHCSIGQGFITTTPLQMAVATATIANGGKLYRPQIVDYMTDSAGEIFKLTPEVLDEKVASGKNIEIVREGMRQTITGASGSARQLDALETEVAGKTGTAQFGTNDKTHSWFTSFAPYEKPIIAMAVLIEGGGEGHSWAVPASEDIYRWYFGEEETEEGGEEEFLESETQVED